MPVWFFALGALHVPVYSSALNPLYLLIAVFPLGFLYWNNVGPRSLWLYSTVFLIGTAVGSFQINRLCESQLPKQSEGGIYDLSFKVVSIPSVKKDSVTFVANVFDVHCKLATDIEQHPCPKLSGKRVRLSWYYPRQSVKAGQLWRASAKLKRPRGFVNPHGFDYQAWLLSQQVMATGYVRPKDNTRPQRLAESVALASIRQQFKERLLQGSKTRFSRFWSALLVGDRSGITNEDWDTLQVTGTVHLMAISGLHIGLVAFACFGLGLAIIRLCALSSHRSGALLHQCLPAMLSIAGALFYAALAGFSIPTLRALTACVLVNVCVIVGVNMPSSLMLGICVAIVAVLEPLAWTSMGFWLSFTAVGVLLFSFGARVGAKSRWTWLYVQSALFVGMLLPLVFIGQGVSLVAPLANLIAVPVVSLFIVPTLLIAALLQPIADVPSQFMLSMVDDAFGYLWLLLEYLQSLSLSRWWPSQSLSLGVLIAGFAGSLLMLAPLGLRIKALGLVWIIYASYGRFAPSKPFELTVLDVGQGLSVHIKTPSQSWLYDTGPSYPSGFDSGSRIILPYLRGEGVKNISMVVSHDDLDHSGGTSSLLKGLTVDRLVVGEPLNGLESSDSLVARLCERGQEWKSGALDFSVLWPPPDHDYEGNRASCVIDLRYSNGGKHVKVLLAGDIDRYVERRLLEDLPSEVDILVAPHHGSNSSSSLAFVARVNPKHVIFSSGYNNRYRHPSVKVTGRYQEAGAQIYETGTDGAIKFTLDEQGVLTAKKYRDVDRKLWFLDDERF